LVPAVILGAVVEGVVFAGATAEVAGSTGEFAAGSEVVGS